jgi:hypothetical protein
MSAVRFQLPASSTTKEAFIAAIKEMAARAIAAERERGRADPSPPPPVTAKSPG